MTDTAADPFKYPGLRPATQCAGFTIAGHTVRVAPSDHNKRFVTIRVFKLHNVATPGGGYVPHAWARDPRATSTTFNVRRVYYRQAMDQLVPILLMDVLPQDWRPSIKRKRR